MTRLMLVILYFTLLNFSYVVSKEINVLYKLASSNVLIFAIFVFLIILANDEE